ncbi:hypothetical protein [Teichococcus aestuarii]|uniref:hypothetical protein n=1 Tax=Teichococcus aestuarii TaxID=568898 RepID=UPI003610B502
MSPDRMRREVEAMVAGLLSWAGEEGRIEVRERLEELASQLAEGVEAAQEATADLDSSDRIGLRQAEAAVAVLRAAHDAFKAAQAAIQ